VENIKLGGEYAGWRILRWVHQGDWRIKCCVENIKVGGNFKLGGEQNAGWRISSWVEIIKLGGEYQAGWQN